MTTTAPCMSAHSGEPSKEEGQETDSVSGRRPLALGQGLAAPVGPGEGALAAAPGLRLGLVHLCVDLVVAFGRLPGRRVSYRHRPEGRHTALRNPVPIFSIQEVPSVQVPCTWPYKDSRRAWCARNCR
ncbi:hypothetical protein MRX96_051260 [Rhipicephalus microplus]